MAEQVYLVKGSTLTGVADAIRSKVGITEAFPLSEFASKIASISAGGICTIWNFYAYIFSDSNYYS